MSYKAWYKYELGSQSDVQHQPDIRDLNINELKTPYLTFVSHKLL